MQRTNGRKCKGPISKDADGEPSGPKLAGLASDWENKKYARRGSIVEEKDLPYRTSRMGSDGWMDIVSGGPRRWHRAKSHRSRLYGVLLRLREPLLWQLSSSGGSLTRVVITMFDRRALRGRGQRRREEGRREIEQRITGLPRTR